MGDDQALAASNSLIQVCDTLSEQLRPNGSKDGTMPNDFKTDFDEGGRRHSGVVCRAKPRTRLDYASSDASLVDLVRTGDWPLKPGQMAVETRAAGSLQVRRRFGRAS